MESFRECWKRQGNDQRTETKDAPSLPSAASTPRRARNKTNPPPPNPPLPPPPPETTPPPSPLTQQNNHHQPRHQRPLRHPPPLRALHPLPSASSDPTSTTTTNNANEIIDWSTSFHGLSATPFPKECADILLAPVDAEEIEIKPDGLLYLPEIKYRRILNKAFGPGGWGLVPRGESIVTPKLVTREYALVCHGRLVSVARGEQDYFSADGIPTATEGCRSNALVRCCKDLGIASELWDPRWIRKFKAKYTREAFVEHVVNHRKTKIWVRKDDVVGYPYKENK
ncbi:mitochondrial genome maintenance MGM101 [Aspergillus heteromorphus CBS 117.55]|uniref:Mitochondrial genome maintenance protein MGM101 n=1 Tax=Aspergillus heteromorphus CBS 117.55 TaxID=1448321 RepID=A0A317V6L8_9EURO|nr:mitochondrial genome maintenance MGM101 [Aspergillus heteromorphus CBS 117.55]PWY68688.1 mitochondrial genome maintenance MGM101 [Aspergillus heteromorphus CBS 117.55]